MRGVPTLLVPRDVSEAELVKAVATFDLGVHGVYRKQDEPGYEPDREKHACGHPEKAYEEIRV